MGYDGVFFDTDCERPKWMNDRYAVVDMNRIPSVPCPCGQTQRAFADDPDRVASIHLVEISDDAKLHYHKQTTEIYFILEGSGLMELDGTRVPVHPGMSILIKPGCRHRAVGRMKILNIPVPAFDPRDEFVAS
jgi:mannose-6-phosphate isomerase-like protein (cupin superfamily)